MVGMFECKFIPMYDDFKIGGDDPTFSIGLLAHYHKGQL